MLYEGDTSSVAGPAESDCIGEPYVLKQLKKQYKLAYQMENIIHYVVPGLEIAMITVRQEVRKGKTVHDLEI